MKKILFLLLVVCLFSSCSNDSVDSNGNDGSGEIPDISIVDIVGVHTLYVAPRKSSATFGMSLYGDGSGSATVELPDVLYSIDDAGNVEAVPFLDENNEPVAASIEVKYVLNVNADYVLMNIVQRYDIAFRDDVILTRKSDGAVFSMENAGRPAVVQTGLSGVPYIRANDNSLFFFENDTYGEVLKKVNLNTLEVKTASLKNDDGKFITWADEIFYIDDAANVAYATSTIDGFRFIKASGGYANISGKPVFTLFGKIFALEDPYSFENRLSAISVNATTGEIEHDIYGVPDSYNGGGTPITSGNRNFLLDSHNLTIYKLDETNKAMTVFNDELGTRFSPQATTTKSAVSDNYFYVSGLDSSVSTIARASHSSLSVEYKNLPEWDIGSINPTDDSVTFTATNFNTSKHVLAELAWATGTVTILETLGSSSSNDVITLERIN